MKPNLSNIDWSWVERWDNPQPAQPRLPTTSVCDARQEGEYAQHACDDPTDNHAWHKCGCGFLWAVEPEPESVRTIMSMPHKAHNGAIARMLGMMQPGVIYDRHDIARMMRVTGNVASARLSGAEKGGYIICVKRTYRGSGRTSKFRLR